MCYGSFHLRFWKLKHNDAQAKVPELTELILVWNGDGKLRLMHFIYQTKIKSAHGQAWNAICGRFIIETVSPGGRFTELGMSVLKVRSPQEAKKAVQFPGPSSGSHEQCINCHGEENLGWSCLRYVGSSGDVVFLSHPPCWGGPADPESPMPL